MKNRGIIKRENPKNMDKSRFRLKKGVADEISQNNNTVRNRNHHIQYVNSGNSPHYVPEYGNSRNRIDCFGNFLCICNSNSLNALDSKTIVLPVRRREKPKCTNQANLKL